MSAKELLGIICFMLALGTLVTAISGHLEPVLGAVGASLVWLVVWASTRKKG